MTISVDLHIHSCLSPCGQDEMTPNNIVGMAFLKGLTAIALTDHNACANVPAVLQVAKQMGVVVVPGMEVTTREEVHALCYFPEWEALVDFSKWLRPHFPEIPNHPRLFGEQWVMNEEDEIIDTCPHMLLSAHDVSIEQIEEQALLRQGVMVPAHINRQRHSVLASLGMMPMDLKARTVEVYGYDPVPEAEGFFQIHSSDAHDLGSILEPVFQLEVETCSANGIIRTLRSGNR